MDLLEDSVAPPVTDADLGPDDLILNRLNAAIATDATARDLEKALAKVDGEIASSNEGVYWVTVTIPKAADLADVEAVAATLTDTDAFTWAWPATLVRPPEEPTARRQAPPNLGGGGNTYLDKQRFFGAWNASALATNKALVYVADAYVQNEPTSQLSALRFQGPAPGDTTALGPSNKYEGNHGFWVASVLGADADEVAPCGTHPDPTRTLDLVALNDLAIGSMVDIILMVHAELPRDRMLVLNTSFGELEPGLSTHVGALVWRELFFRRPAPFLSVVSSGNDGSRDREGVLLNSAITLEANLDDLVLPASEDPERVTQLLFDEAVARAGAGMRKRSGVSLAVGASTAQGEESIFSNGPADVRMTGEGMLGQCGREDPPCGPTQDCSTRCDDRLLKIADGTSAAAPMASGLAAWLLAIDPTLTAYELYDLMTMSFDGRWVDAMNATLALEVRGIEVRQAMLDLNDDGQFDDVDITLAIDALDADDTPMWARTDLNGDGTTGDVTTVGLDLDGDGVLGELTIQIPGTEAAILEDVQLDETAITDLDFLCWGAFAGPFVDDAAARDRRDDVLRGRCGVRPALVMLTLDAFSIAQISVSDYWTGQPSYQFWSYVDGMNEGSLRDDPVLIWTTEPPVGGFSLVEGVNTFTYGYVVCDEFGGWCVPDGDNAYSGDASSFLNWACSGSLDAGEASCSFAGGMVATATVSDSEVLRYGVQPPSQASTLARSTLQSIFRVDLPTRYELTLGTLELPPLVGTLPGIATASQLASFELSALDVPTGPNPSVGMTSVVRYGRNVDFDTSQGDATGDLQGLLDPGIYRIDLEMEGNIFSDRDHTTGLSSSVDATLTFSAP